MANLGGIFIAVIIIGVVIYFGPNSNGQGGTSTTSVVCPTSPCPFYNANSQKVADLVVSGGWNSQVGMLHDINEPGCNDYESGNPCDATYWTTSDNIPTCWTLGDYGYATIMSQCIAKVTGLGALNPSSAIFGNRYESFVGVLTGTAKGGTGTHGIIKDQIPGPVILAVTNGAPYTAMKQFVSGGGCSGTNSLGCYTIQFDGSGAGSPNTGLSVDTEAPQAIDQWLLGNKVLGQTLANDLVSRYVSSNWVGSGSSWQLGQVLFVMRVYGMDTSDAAAFNNGVTELWSTQNSAGYLPNSYSSACISAHTCSGHDPENEDAGLLPFSYSVVTMIQNDLGLYAGSNQNYNQNQACVQNPNSKTLPQSWTIACSFTKQVHSGDQLVAFVKAACSSSCAWSWSTPTDTQSNSYSFSIINNTVAYSTVAKTTEVIVIQVLFVNLAPTLVQNPTLFVSDIHPLF